MILAGRFAGLACGIVLACGAAPARTQMIDFVATEGKLPDAEFYSLIACRAVPGGPCRDPLVRWPAAQAAGLGVAMARVPPDYPMTLASDMSRALDRAIAQINAAGAAVRLERRRKGADAPIMVHLVPVGDGGTIRGTGVAGVDGAIIGAGLVTVWWDNARQITRAVIVMAGDLPRDEVQSVMLEELTQSLGLLTDIRNPHYQSRSIFSEDSNDVTTFSPQDLMVLRRHYPDPASLTHDSVGSSADFPVTPFDKDAR